MILKKGRKVFAIEIKSSENVDTIEVNKMGRVSDALNPTEKIYVSNDPVTSQIGDVKCMHWKSFFEIYSESTHST